MDSNPRTGTSTPQSSTTEGGNTNSGGYPSRHRDAHHSSHHSHHNSHGRPSSGGSVDERCPGSDRASEKNDVTKLFSAWRVYYDIRPVVNVRQHSRAENYENNLQPLYEFGTVESFARLFNHLPAPATLPVNANYHLFRAHIKPMWEHPLNSDGGEFRYTFSRTVTPDVTNAVWREVIMLLVGEQADPEEGICGVVFSRRGKGDRLSIWTRSNAPTAMLDEIQVRLTNHLSAQQPPPTPAYASKQRGIAPTGVPRHLRGVPLPDLTFEFTKRGGGNILTPMTGRPPLSAGGVTKGKHARGMSSNAPETVTESNEEIDQ